MKCFSHPPHCVASCCRWMNTSGIFVTGPYFITFTVQTCQRAILGLSTVVADPRSADTHTHEHTRTHTYTHAHTRTHTYTHVHTRTHTYTHAHTRTHTYTHAHTRTHTYAHVHTRIHVHARTCKQGKQSKRTNLFVIWVDFSALAPLETSSKCVSVF